MQEKIKIEPQNRINVAEYTVNYLANLGVRYVFLVTGGAIVNTVDAFRKNPDISYICTAHEQGAAMAAEAYSRVTGNIGVAMSTSGPGATNLITGITGAYFDSIPTLYITGQVNITESLENAYTNSLGNPKPRQVGFQEMDVIGLVKPITKWAVKIKDPNKIKYYLDKAIYLAKSERPGPVLLDIPNDIQREIINPGKLEGFTPEIKNPKEQDDKINSCIKLIQSSKRPIILVGAGIKLAKANNDIEEFIEKTGIPVVTSWGGKDIVPFDHNLNIGVMGVSSNRGPNFAIQNSELLISIGARLETRKTGRNIQDFARNAKKIVVDIDEGELNREIADIPIKMDAKEFLQLINKKINSDSVKQNIQDWVKKTQEWKQKYPICLKEYYLEQDKVNPYVFLDVLSKQAKENDIITTDTGSTLCWTMQGFNNKQGQKIFSAFGLSPMGYSLPASMGASFANDKKQVLCISGDGGVQMNIQELQTIIQNKLPIKIFVLNNNCYGIQRQFQDVWLDSRHEATTKASGCPFPDLVKVAGGYGFEVISIKNNSELEEKIKQALNSEGPVFCNIEIPSDAKIIPKLEFGKPIEDLSPPLDRKEFAENMLITSHKNLEDGEFQEQKTE